MIGNLSKNIQFSSFDVDSGSKYWEQIANGGPTKGLVNLLMSGWSGSRVVFVGDYSNGKLYSEIRNYPSVKPSIDDVDTSKIIVVNRKRKEFIYINMGGIVVKCRDFSKQFNDTHILGACLIVLIAISDHSGGGDPPEPVNMEGVWSEDQIDIVTSLSTPEQADVLNPKEFLKCFVGKRNIINILNSLSENEYSNITNDALEGFKEAYGY